MPEPPRHLTTLYAAVAAAASFLLAPLLAMAYVATDDGRAELETATVSGWMDPAREAAGGLLTFASPDDVYGWYGRAFALLVPALVVSARAVRRRRPAAMGRLERSGWRLALAGYWLLAAGLVVAFWTPLLTASFYVAVLPGLLLSFSGSTALGVALLRSGFPSRLAGLLLALSFVLWVAGSAVLGHNSLGVVPLLVAWAAAAWRLARVDAADSALDARLNGPRRGSVAPPHGSASVGR